MKYCYKCDAEIPDGAKYEPFIDPFGREIYAWCATCADKYDGPSDEEQARSREFDLSEAEIERAFDEKAREWGAGR